MLAAAHADTHAWIGRKSLAIGGRRAARKHLTKSLRYVRGAECTFSLRLEFRASPNISSGQKGISDSQENTTIGKHTIGSCMIAICLHDTINCGKLVTRAAIRVPVSKDLSAQLPRRDRRGGHSLRHVLLTKQLGGLFSPRWRSSTK